MGNVELTSAEYDEQFEKLKVGDLIVVSCDSQYDGLVFEVIDKCIDEQVTLCNGVEKTRKVTSQYVKAVTPGIPEEYREWLLMKKFYYDTFVTIDTWAKVQKGRYKKVW